MKSSLFIIAVILITGCTSNVQLQTYGYVFHESTGITNHIGQNGKEIPVKFSSKSNSQNIAALKSLKWNILYPNSGGNKIYVIGVLGHREKMTPSGPNLSNPEKYRDFALADWYITVPFIEIRLQNESIVPHQAENVTRYILNTYDFSDFDGKEKIDLTKFQK
jgi:hypothetical protein